uniref:Uncharacterized protein n=1 Tax=Globisporangium ultimum (strain ATCC 200006 / CBS 805.95 / DAOM BR144) TaxID=431595 RepID=K3X3D8_GLOUD
MENERLDSKYNSLFWNTDGETVTKFVPAPLPRTQQDHSIIDVLTDELLQREIPAYMDEFEIVIPDAEIVVGSLPLEEVQQREHAVEEAKLRQAEIESGLYRQREMHLAKQEEYARSRLLSEAKRQRDELAKKHLQFAEVMQLRTRRLGYVFQQAESHLKDELERQQARVAQVYGDLAHSHVPQSRKRYRVEWQKIPVTLRIRAKMLKAVKDKLPRGHYVMVATLYDRLGGHALHWSAWDPEYDSQHKPQRHRHRGHQRKQRRSDESENEAFSSSPLVGNQIRHRQPNFTRPFAHRGRFYNTEVAIHQNMFVVCPPECSLRPGNVLVFELFHLGSERSRGTDKHPNQQATDQVVAWGAMPLCSPDFQHVRGKFKIPLLRGEMDPTMDKFRDIEHMYHDDLSAWLCNFYFQVTHEDAKTRLPSEGVNGAEGEEFDIEIDERSGLYRFENNHQRYVRKLTTKSIKRAQGSRRNLLLPQTQNDTVGGEVGGVSNHIRTRRQPAATELVNCDADEEKARLLPGHQPTGDATAEKSAFPSPRTLLLDRESNCAPDERRKVRKKQKSPSRGGSSSSSAFAPALSALRESWKRMTTVKKKVSRVYSGDAMEKTTQVLHDTSDGDGVADASKMTQGAPARPRTLFSHSGSEYDEDSGSSSDEQGGKHFHHELDVENYTFAVNAATSVETAHHKRFHVQRKLFYLRHELLVDLGASNCHTLEFWRLIVLLLFALWIRLYVHYVMQWIFLRGSRIPVYDFRPEWSTCLVKYTWRTISTHTEIGVIVFGSLGNIFLFGFLALAGAVGQAFVGELPHFGSNFIVCVGIATILDPYLVLVVDVLKHHYSCAALNNECLESLASSKCKCVNGDAFKLYVRFLAQEGSGLVGIALTLIIYAALTCVSLVCVYAYLLHVHMNGRMLDVYRRVHGHEDTFFVPHDSEIGLQDLKAICEQARRWKGPRGTQRKVFVHDYVLTDPLDPQFEEKNVHITVYNMELDGKRELHRHFLKSNDGAIIELFGEIGTGKDGIWKHDAHGAMSLALLYNIVHEQKESAETTAEELAKLFAGV